MRSERSKTALKDILANIELAESFIEEVTLEQFLTDIQRIYATTRALEIISEATRRLPVEMKAGYESVAWRDIAGAGNIYRHGYDVLIAEVLWDTAKNGLKDLRDMVEAELASPK